MVLLGNPIVYAVTVEQSTAYVQPKEMPFCLARLMTICVLDAGDKVEMQDEDGVSG
jgi:hypothetical protein